MARKVDIVCWIESVCFISQMQVVQSLMRASYAHLLWPVRIRLQQVLDHKHTLGRLCVLSLKLDPFLVNCVQ